MMAMRKKLQDAQNNPMDSSSSGNNLKSMQAEELTPAQSLRQAVAAKKAQKETGVSGLPAELTPTPHPAAVSSNAPTCEGKLRLNSLGLPSRPGKTACKSFLEHGACKFGLNCWHDHPMDGESSEPQVELNSRGMPLRPDKPFCGYYLKFNMCKFGPECRLHHPEHLGGLGPLPGMGDGAMLTVENLPLRPGKDPCPFFMKAGNCHFGPACRFDHSVKKGDEAANSGAAQAQAKKEAPPSKRKAAGLGGTKSKRPPASTFPVFH